MRMIFCAKVSLYWLKSVTSGVLVTSAIVVCLSLSQVSLARQVYLDQGWDEQREAFYNLSQGSQLVPYDFFLALENYRSVTLVRSDRSMKRWGYLPADKNYNHLLNPDRLPIGFVKDVDVADGSEYVGYTCAACHTGQINYRGKKIRIDGGQPLSDFVGFMRHLKLSFQETKDRPGKFRRFARRLNIELTDENVSVLKARLEKSIESLNRVVYSTAAVGNTGIGRIDAFGSIGNSILVHKLGEADNFSPPRAPVSIPFLWQTSELERTQYTGIAEFNFSRNVGEVLGVFGQANLQDPELLFENSIQGENLFLLENMVRQLRPPQWPEEILGEIDYAAAERGYDVYTKIDDTGYSCVSCHTLPNAEGEYPLTPAENNLFGKQFIKTINIPLQEIGTDGNAANLIFQPFLAETGALSVFFENSEVAPSFLIQQFVFGALTQRLFFDLGLSDYEQAAYSGFRFYTPGNEPSANVAAYRARPLPGIWATSPYLHNGSVRNLVELLKPEGEREESFYVGSRRFDPVRVGYRSGWKYRPMRQKFDTSLDGNSAEGHDYGTCFSEEEKWDLIEFLKTL